MMFRSDFLVSAKFDPCYPITLPLLIVLGNLSKTPAAQPLLRCENCLESLKIAETPVKFPDNREHSVETGSHMTGHTTKPFKNLAAL